MDGKEKRSIEKIGKYLREISVVVIGVAITLSASYWISNTGKKRDMILYLNAIKLELEENIETLERAIEDLKPSIRYSNYLQSLDAESLDRDSINSYRTVAMSVLVYPFQTNAFEMFKNSGVMHLIGDKKLLLSLWDMHEELIGAREFSDWYFQNKWSDLKQEFSLLIEGQKPKVAPMYHFYIMTMPELAMTSYEKTLKKAKELVLNLGNRK